MSLYLKYRPKTIEELDITRVRRALAEVVQANQVGHAYLLTGPRGAGKTSAARILARVVNCEHNSNKLDEPCNECQACLSILNGSAVDVIEIDAASNRGIDDMRELKDKIRLAPTSLVKKVYIIDEVHMLTAEAFNALLKTLEEPPAHAIFVLCTTEAHKVPDTIVSRCVRILFTKATPEEMIRSFTRVINGEGAEVEEAALKLLAESVDGSFRDGIKVLDSLVAKEKKITAKDIEEALFGASGFESMGLARALIKRDLAQALSEFRQACQAGTDLVFVTTQTMKKLREAILTGLGVEQGELAGETELTKLIYKLDEALRLANTSPAPEMMVEMVIIEWCVEGTGNKRAGRTQGRASEEPAKKEIPKKETKDKELKEEELAGEVEDVGETWGKILAGLEGESYSMGALLTKARPGQIRGNTLTLLMEYDFHRTQVMQEKFRARVEKMVSEAVGRPMKIECEVGKLALDNKLQNPPQVDTIAPEDLTLIKAAEEIFNN